MGVVVDDIMNYLTMYIYFITNCYIRPTVKRKNGIKYILALTNIVDRRIGCILISVLNDLRQSLAVNSFHGRVAVNVRIRFSASLTKTVPSLVHVSISLFSRLRFRCLEWLPQRATSPGRPPPDDIHNAVGQILILRNSTGVHRFG